MPDEYCPLCLAMMEAGDHFATCPNCGYGEELLPLPEDELLMSVLTEEISYG